MTVQSQTLSNFEWYYALRDDVEDKVATHAHTDWYYRIQAELEKQNEIIGRYFAFTRNLPAKPFGESQKYEYLVDFFANEITGPYDQDISFLLVGNKGRGKSLTALSISFYTSQELLLRLGGHWTDYFNPETNMAIILEDEANRLMGIQKPYQIKNYDDIGIGWGARNWRDEDNKDKNDVFQINRTDNTLQIFSIPNQFLLDKVPRSLVSHYGEMDQKFFEHGFTTIKVFEPETLFREGKIIQPYLAVNRAKYVMFRIPKPPDDLIAYYKKRRKENKEHATSIRLDDEVKAQEQQRVEEEKNRRLVNSGRSKPTVLAMEREMELVAPDLLQDVIAGARSQKEIAELLREKKGFRYERANAWSKNPTFKRLLGLE